MEPTLALQYSVTTEESLVGECILPLLRSLPTHMFEEVRVFNSLRRVLTGVTSMATDIRDCQAIERW